MKEPCEHCGRLGELKRGWTYARYCCETCERESVGRLHASMPGAGPLPSARWIPRDISVQIRERWAAGGAK
jgi:hypothetical protein